jgi:Spy/CpxP family protein refolding chaperone
VFRNHLGALALFAAFALPLAASAQTVPAPGASAQTVPAPGASAPVPAVHRHHRHHNRYMHALRGLQLSDTQKQQIAGIMKNARGANKNADPQTRRANVRALHQQIEGVLTDEQRSQLHAKLAGARQHMARPSGPAPAASPQ